MKNIFPGLVELVEDLSKNLSQATLSGIKGVFSGYFSWTPKFVLWKKVFQRSPQI